MIRQSADVQKRRRDTIVRTLERLEAKYGEAVVRLVANKHFLWKKIRKKNLKQKESLELEMKELNAKIKGA